MRDIAFLRVSELARPESERTGAVSQLRHALAEQTARPLLGLVLYLLASALGMREKVVADRERSMIHGLWLSLVERLSRVQEVQGSNPCSPTPLLAC